MRPHHKYKINWIGFPLDGNSGKKRVRGVYMIGSNIYIGASNNIRKRIVQHLNDCQNLHSNKQLASYLLKHVQLNRPIKVYLLSNDPLKESSYIKKFNPLTNSPNATTYEVTAKTINND